MKIQNIEILCPLIKTKGLGYELFSKVVSNIENNYLRGRKERKFDDLLIKNPKDWDVTSSMPPSEQWHFQTLNGPLAALLNKKHYTDKSIDLATKHTRLWYEWNQSKTCFDDNKQAWSGHTVAIRLGFLVALFLMNKNKDQTWLKSIIDQHIKFLSDPDNYEGNWNHGLDQNIALITASYIFKKEDSMMLAYKRIQENFDSAFDNEGVNNEQSTAYHHYNIHRYSHIIKLFELLELDKDFIKNKINQSYVFFAHSLLPNGNYTPIGDSAYIRPIFHESNPEIEYLITQKESGAKPDYYLEQIYRAGYIFGRSSWDISDNPSHYSIRFGKERLIHGHNDHMSLTFYANHNMVIADGGFPGYTEDFSRDYFRSPRSHNVVIADDPKEKFLWNETTNLISHKHHEKSDSYYYLLSDKPHHHTSRKRAVLINVRNNFFITIDNINSKNKKKFSQFWHFFPGINIKYMGSSSFEVKDKSHKYKLLILQNNNTTEIFHGYSKIEKGKINNLCGYIGLDHNKIEKSHTIKTSTHGDDCTFITCFGNYEDDIITLKPDFSLIKYNDKYLYYLSKNMEIIEYKIIENHILNTMTSNDKKIVLLASKDGVIKIKNTSLSKKKFILNLNQYLTKKTNAICFFVSCLGKSNNAFEYYYISSTSNKLRYENHYLVDISNDDDTNFSIVLKPNTDISININFISLYREF